MRARLIAAVAAVVTVTVLVVWGLGQLRERGQSSLSGDSAAAAQESAPAPASVSPAPPRVLAPAGAGWQLKFASDFSGPQLDARVWSTCYPFVHTSPGCTNFGNIEYEWYIPSQVRVSGGVLHLEARHVPVLGLNAQGGPKEYPCRSGMVTTYPGYHFKYGYVQVVARVPNGPGLWPAMWLAAASLRWPPEMDILEHWGHNFRTGVYFHPVGVRQVTQHLHIADLSSKWHTFALSWTSSRIVWYVDGGVVLSVNRHIPHQAMYFIANLADYKMPGGRGCEGTMLIRSVKVWQR